MSGQENKTPLYAQIKAYLLAEIKAGRLAPGDRVPSEADLARQFGVSRVTSKQAMTQLAQDGLIRRSPGAGSFVTEPPATQAPGNAIGIVLPLLTARHELELLRGVEGEASQYGYQLMIRQSGGQQTQEAQAIRDLVDARVGGLIIWPVHGTFYNTALLELCVKGFPTVLVDRLLDGIPLSGVTSDNLEGGRLAVEQLLQWGHRHIGILSPPIDWASSVRDRVMGCGMALSAAGVPTPHDAWMTSLETDPDENRAQIRSFLEENPKITAVVAVHEGIGAAAYQAARELGRRVPEDLSILSFDLPDQAAVDGKVFCHVSQQAEAIGRQAVQVLHQRIAEDDPTIRSVQVPVKWVSGSTCSVLSAGEAGKP